MKNLILAGVLTLSCLHIAAQQHIWVKGFGGEKTDVGISMALDKSGNTISSGTFSGRVDFDPGSDTFFMSSVYNPDNSYISKLDKDGGFVWAKQLAGFWGVSVKSMCLDDSDNIYLTGFYAGPADFDPGASVYLDTAVWGADYFVLKLDKDGDFIWVRTIGEKGDERGCAVSVDKKGNVLTAGLFEIDTDFDPGPAVWKLISNGSSDIAIVKYDPQGNFLWAGSAGSGSQDEVASVRTDAAGNIYVGGMFQDTADLDPGPARLIFKSMKDGYDMFYMKLDTSGHLIWVNQLGGIGSEDIIKDLYLDEKGNIYLTGCFFDTVDFDPGLGVHKLMFVPGAPNAYVAKYDPEGKYKWAKCLGGGSDSKGYSIHVDRYGNVLSAGGIRGHVDFDPGPGVVDLASSGFVDIYISKLDSNGNYKWAKCMGGVIYDDIPMCMTMDTSDHIYMTGKFYGKAALIPIP